MTKARNEYYMFKLVFKARNNQSLKKISGHFAHFT